MASIDMSALKPSPNASVIVGLQKAVAQSFALTALASNAHTNVTGPDFFTLHGVFGEIYSRAFASVDLLAERMRALGSFVNMCMTEMDKVSGLPCLDAPFSAQEAVATILRAQDIIIADLTGLMNVADASGDKPTSNIIQDEIAAVQKSQWMLRSYLRD